MPPRVRASARQVPSSTAAKRKAKHSHTHTHVRTQQSIRQVKFCPERAIESESGNWKRERVAFNGDDGEGDGGGCCALLSVTTTTTAALVRRVRQVAYVMRKLKRRT